MNVVIIILLSLISLLVLLLMLSYNGSFVSFTNLHDQEINLEINKHHFLGNYSFASTKDKYNDIVKKLKFLDIFSYKHDDMNLKTVIHRKNSDKPVQLDDVVSVTTRFASDNLFTTSYEKVAILEETDNSFIMCMTSCTENIINGYYRIKVEFNNRYNSITINYAKVQTLSPLILRLALDGVFGNKSYIEANIASVKNTIHFLSGRDDYNIESVLYFYK